MEIVINFIVGDTGFDPASSHSCPFEQFYVKTAVQKFSPSETYHAVVSPHWGHYNRLGLEEQRKIPVCTYLFKNSKHFHYIAHRKG